MTRSSRGSARTRSTASPGNRASRPTGLRTSSRASCRARSTGPLWPVRSRARPSAHVVADSIGALARREPANARGAPRCSGVPREWPGRAPSVLQIGMFSAPRSAPESAPCRTNRASSHDCASARSRHSRLRPCRGGHSSDARADARCVRTNTDRGRITTSIVGMRPRFTFVHCCRAGLPLISLGVRA